MKSTNLVPSIPYCQYDIEQMIKTLRPISGKKCQVPSVNEEDPVSTGPGPILKTFGSPVPREVCTVE